MEYLLELGYWNDHLSSAMRSHRCASHIPAIEGNASMIIVVAGQNHWFDKNERGVFRTFLLQN